MRRLFLIANPVAGRGAALRARSEVRAGLERAGVEHDIALTRAPGEAVELARAASRQGWDAVVAVGGDGTVHEVANGVLDAAEVAMGVVPAGSGNDFAFAAGIPGSIPKALQVLLDGRPTPVDAGRVCDRWFVNGVGIGLDARVAIEANRARRLRGIAMYLHALARVLRSYTPPRLRVEVDGVLWMDEAATLLTIGNGPRQGGGFRMNPSARIGDGMLHLCGCGALGTLRILRFLPYTLRGTHVGLEGVRCTTGQRIQVTSPDPLAVHADGEIVAEHAAAVAIRLQPGRLSLLTPPAQDGRRG